MNDLLKRLRARTVPSWVHSPGDTPRMSGHKPDALCQEAADEIERVRAELQHARDGLTKGRSRMREDLERHKPLVQAVEWVVEEGYMHVEDLARLRAALDGLRHNVRANLRAEGPSS